tara:strand:- start:503 stop:895 length:393 start_codon:yes stop_codon:yes gene_type:complete
MGAMDVVTDELLIFHRSSVDVVSEDVLTCDGLLLATTENIGYMAGLTKDLFDRCYDKWLGTTDGLPTAIYIRAGIDGTATSRAMSQIASGLSWRLIRPPLILKGDYSQQFEGEVAELAGAFAAGLETGLF